MYPLTVGLAIETKELWEAVQSCVQDLAVRVVIEQQDVADFPGFRDRVERMRPDILLVEIARLRVPLEEVVRNIRSLCPDCMLIALHAAADSEMILAAMRAGVNEFLNPPLEVNLRRALERRAKQQAARRSEASRREDAGISLGQGRLRSDYDRLPRGGGTGAPGRPQSAAGGLRHGCGHGRIPHEGQVAVFHPGCRQESTAPGCQLLECFGIERNSRGGNHRGARRVGFRPQPKEEQLRQVLGFLRSHYDFTLVDLGRSLNPVALCVLEELDEVYLVSTLEVPAMHRAKHIIQTLFDSGFAKDRLRLVLNRVPKRVDVTPEELEKMLGLPVFAMLPNDYPLLHDCYSEGKLLDRGSNLEKQLARFAGKLAGVLPESKKKRSVFG